MASLTDINITKPATNALTKVKKLETYDEFIEIVKEYNTNKAKLDENLRTVKKADPKTIKEDRDEYFLTLIKKQASLKNIPKNAGVSTFDLLYKRALKLNAIISVYANGKKTKEYEDFEIFSAKEKWKNKLMDTKISKENSKVLLEKCKYWLDYLKKLIRFLENEKNESKVEELFSDIIKNENKLENKIEKKLRVKNTLSLKRF